MLICHATQVWIFRWIALKKSFKLRFSWSVKTIFSSMSLVLLDKSRVFSLLFDGEWWICYRNKFLFHIFFSTQYTYFKYHFSYQIWIGKDFRITLLYTVLFFVYGHFWVRDGLKINHLDTALFERVLIVFGAVLTSMRTRIRF